PRRATISACPGGGSMAMAMTNVRTNLRDPIRRHNVIWLMAGKLIGLAAVLLLIHTLVPHVAHAQDASGGADADASINAINTAWVLIAAFLVFGMQVGFVMLESG